MASNIGESELVNTSEDADRCNTDETAKLLIDTSKGIDLGEYEKENENSSDKIKSTFKKKGVAGVALAMKNRLDNWKTEEVDIAVIGRTGVGKSSFINAIRDDLNEKHPDYAKVGHNECTSERKSYPHPSNQRLRFWDLPGVGTATFPRKTYLKNKELRISCYDAFILITSDRFTEDEAWLASEIKKMGKMFLFVRSRVDQQIDSDRISKEKAGEVSDPLKVIEDIRQNCAENMGEHFGAEGGYIFLINSLNINQEGLDFEKLLNRLVTGFTDFKAEVMLTSMGFLTASVLEDKIKSLKKRIWAMGVLSSLSGAIPIPGTSLIADGFLIVNEIRLYRKSLGLSDDDLKVLGKIMGLSIDELVQKYSLRALSLPITIKGVVASLTLVGSEIVESAVKLSVPVIGMAVGAVISFGTTVSFLRSVLTILEKDARLVLELLQIHTGHRVILMSMTETTQRAN